LNRSIESVPGVDQVNIGSFSGRALAWALVRALSGFHALTGIAVGALLVATLSLGPTSTAEDSEGLGIASIGPAREHAHPARPLRRNASAGDSTPAVRAVLGPATRSGRRKRDPEEQRI